MRKVLFFLLINLLFTGKNQGQNVPETYAKAEAFFQDGQYAEAAKLYERVLFFTAETDTLKPGIYFSAAKAFLATGQYEKAVKYFNNAIYLSQNKLFIQQARFQKIKSLLLLHDYNLAKTELEKTDTVAFPHLKNQYYFYAGIYFFGVEKFDSTKKYFLKLVDNDQKKQTALEKLFRKNNRSRLLDSSFAGVLSAVIPGSGQVYSGEIDKGVNSFLLTSAFAVLGYNTFVAYGLLEAVVSVSPWFARYYISGIVSASELTNEKKDKKGQKIFSKMLNLITEDSL